MFINAKSNVGITPLHWAVMQGNKSVVELLLANKADVNAKRYMSFTPLHEAAMHGYKDVAELLLAKGADITAESDTGLTPLHMATSSYGRKDVAELLLQHGARNPVEGPPLFGSRLKNPVLLANPLPPYTEEARKARVKGILKLQVVVRKDGTVDDVKVLNGLGYGLDESAVNTISTKWRFKPGTLGGTPVDVKINIEVYFTIK